MKLPEELINYIGDEKLDFAVKSKRNQRITDYSIPLTIGSIWSAMAFVTLIVQLMPILHGDENNFETDGTGITGIFLLCGLAILMWVFLSLTPEGGYFVGTKKQLIHYHQRQFQIFPWEKLTCDMEINVRKGDLVFYLFHGEVKGTNTIQTERLPNVVYIAGVADVLAIERICRERINNASLSV